MEGQNLYSLMEYPTDGNTLSILHLKNIIEPKKPFNDYKEGDTGLCRFPGFPGKWPYIIHAVGPSREHLAPILKSIEGTKVTQKTLDEDFLDSNTSSDEDHKSNDFQEREKRLVADAANKEDMNHDKNSKGLKSAQKRKNDEKKKESEDMNHDKNSKGLQSAQKRKNDEKKKESAIGLSDKVQSKDIEKEVQKKKRLENKAQRELENRAREAAASKIQTLRQSSDVVENSSTLSSVTPSSVTQQSNRQLWYSSSDAFNGSDPNQAHLDSFDMARPTSIPLESNLNDQEPSYSTLSSGYYSDYMMPSYNNSYNTGIPYQQSSSLQPTSSLMKGAFNTLYGATSPRSACTFPSNASECHGCCSIFSQQIEQLEATIQELQRKLKVKNRENADKDVPTDKGVTCIYNGHSLEALKLAAERSKSVSDAVNTLLTKMFTVNELTTSSVMGVATVKGKKPSLDPERRAIVESLILEKFDSTTATIHAVMRDRLKLIRKKYS